MQCTLIDSCIQILPLEEAGNVCLRLPKVQNALKALCRISNLHVTVSHHDLHRPAATGDEHVSGQLVAALFALANFSCPAGDCMLLTCRQYLVQLYKRQARTMC